MPIGTRIALYYLLIFLVLPLALGIVLSLVGVIDPPSPDDAPPDLLKTLWIQAMLLPPVIAVTAVWVRRIDRKSLSEIGVGWPGGSPEHAAGALVASLGGAVALLGLWSIAVPMLGADGGVVLKRQSGIDTGASFAELLSLAVALLAASCLEEWVFRGYVYTTLREKLSWVHAGGVTSALFAVLHMSNPEVGTAGLVNTFLLGFALAAIREQTQSLWTAIVAHAAWNFFMGAILSLPVSGYSTPSLYTVRVEGDEAWTGGAYGPEGSWSLVVLLLLTLVALASRLSGETDEDGTDSPASAG